MQIKHSPYCIPRMVLSSIQTNMSSEKGKVEGRKSEMETGVETRSEISREREIRLDPQDGLIIDKEQGEFRDGTGKGQKGIK